MKLPPLSEVLTNPSIRQSLTNAQLQALLEQLKSLLPRDGSTIPDNPAAFAQVFSKGIWYPAKHLDYLSQWLAECEQGKRRRIMVSMPPRHGKSELISFWFPLWLLARNPRRKIILTSYEDEFAMQWGRRIRNAINDIGSQLGLELDTTSSAAKRWDLVTGGSMRTAGAGGPITGMGADFLIIDDPIKNSEEASSEVIRNKLYDWFQTTAYTRLEPGGSVIMVATRWHQDDLLGRLERQGRTEDGLQWDIIKFPAIATEDDPLGREPGDPLWPERISLEELLIKKKGLSPYNWSSVFQQSPSPEEGGGVRRAWWKYYATSPEDSSNPLRPKDHEFDTMIQCWDLAFKDLKTGSYTVGQVWGRKGADLYLVDQVRDFLDAPAVIRSIRAFADRYPRATAKLVEDKANGPAVIAILQHELGGMIPIKVRASKDARLQAVVPLIASGNVYVPNPQDNPWVWDLIEECAAFPMGQYDDQLDAMVHALTYLQPQGWLELSRAAREAAKPAQPQNPVEHMNMSFKAFTDKKKKLAAKRVNNKLKFTRLLT